MARWQFVLAFGAAAGLTLFLVSSFAGLIPYAPLYMGIGLLCCLCFGWLFGFVLDVLL